LWNTRNYADSQDGDIPDSDGPPSPKDGPKSDTGEERQRQAETFLYLTLLPRERHRDTPL
jgi:hypothetical protein